MTGICKYIDGVDVMLYGLAQKLPDEKIKYYIEEFRKCYKTKILRLNSVSINCFDEGEEYALLAEGLFRTAMRFKAHEEKEVQTE